MIFSYAGLHGRVICYQGRPRVRYSYRFDIPTVSSVPWLAQDFVVADVGRVGDEAELAVDRKHRPVVLMVIGRDDRAAPRPGGLKDAQLERGRDPPAAIGGQDSRDPGPADGGALLEGQLR